MYQLVVCQVAYVVARLQTGEGGHGLVHCQACETPGQLGCQVVEGEKVAGDMHLAYFLMTHVQAQNHLAHPFYYLANRPDCFR